MRIGYWLVLGFEEYGDSVVKCRDDGNKMNLFYFVVNIES